MSSKNLCPYQYEVVENKLQSYTVRGIPNSLRFLDQNRVSYYRTICIENSHLYTIFLHFSIFQGDSPFGSNLGISINIMKFYPPLITIIPFPYYMKIM